MICCCSHCVFVVCSVLFCGIVFCVQIFTRKPIIEALNCADALLVCTFIIRGFLGSRPIVNQRNPDQTTQNVASDQCLHCLLIDCILNLTKRGIYHPTV